MAQNSSRYANTTSYTYTTSPSAQVPRYYPSHTQQRRRASADYAYSRPPPTHTANHRYSTHDYQTRSEYVSSAGPRRPPPSYRDSYQSTTPRWTDTSESYRTSHGDSDDDDWVYGRDGKAYLVPGARRTQHSHHHSTSHRQHFTNYHAAQGVRYVDQYGNPVYVNNATRYDEPSIPKRRASTSMPKRSSANQKPTSSSKSKQPPPPPAPRVATEADARKYAIPTGYSLKNWDPDEEPLTLLGSVFDGNSLGKWIYDWTVYRHEAGTPISDMAGELWLLLIALTGKIKRAEECARRIRSKRSRDMVEDFIEGGQRLTDKTQALLKLCETPMLRTSKPRRSSSGKPQLGKNAGVEFVDSIFGRDRYLHKTEKLMSSMRLWSLRFDANCEEILRHPRA